MDSPFWHYNTTFDAVELVRKYSAGVQVPAAGRFLNYFGVVIDPRFFPTILGAGGVEEETLPANWHSDLAEFGAALRAVDLAASSFTMIELGCGWGCWMNITGVAARRAGREVFLIGVEGDPNHVAFAHQSIAENGFAPGQCSIHQGIASATAGEALFPTQDGDHWGLAPIFHPTPEQRDDALKFGRYNVLPMVPLSEIATGHARIDLLHMDIQGGEADLVSESLDFMHQRVAYVVIGTHAREIEGRLWHILNAAGWLLEIERPAILLNVDGKLQLYVDGVQGWRNPSLLPL